MSVPPKTVITFGTFDMLHPGHVRILERARALGDRLVVGVSTDALHAAKGKTGLFYNEATRMEMVRALRCVDDVFEEHALDKKAQYVKQHSADVLVMGDDWIGQFDWVGEETGCNVMYLPRTPEISTTDIKANTVGPSFAPAAP